VSLSQSYVLIRSAGSFWRKHLYISCRKRLQFTKTCKGDMSQHSKTVKMVSGWNYCLLNSRLALTGLAILNMWTILIYP